MNYSYAADVSEIIGINKEEWHKIMKDNYEKMLFEYPSVQQIRAWDDCYVKSLPFF